MTSRSDQDDSYTTRDLVRATYLASCGFDYKLKRDGETRTGAPIGAWVFQRSIELQERVEVFDQASARVEPTAFHKTVNRTRRELMTFLED